MGAVERAELIDQSLVGRTLADMNGEEVEISTPPESPAADIPVEPAEPAAQTEPEPAPQAEPVQEKVEAEASEVLAFKSLEKPVQKDDTTKPAAKPAETPAPAQVDRGMTQRVDVISKRLSLLESRMDGQEENLHRVLTMLIAWVESEVRKKEDVINAGRAA